MNTSVILLIAISAMVQVNGANSARSFSKTTPCGDKKCSCKQETAICRSKKGYGTLTYIPRLPANINRLVFSGGRLTILSKETLVNVSHLELRRLNVIGDRVKSIESTAFADLKYLISLEISKNDKIILNDLSLSLDSIQKDLEFKLVLNDLGISNISTEFFAGLNDGNLTELHLDNNLLTSLSMAPFRGLVYLKKLRVVNNRIQSIDAFSGHLTLSELYLTHNTLFQVGDWFCRNGDSLFPNLRELHLNKNYILVSDLFSAKRLACLPRLQLLDLGENILRDIPGNAISMMSSLLELRLNSMLGMEGRSIKIDTMAFNSSSLRTLNLNSNNIIFTSDHIKSNFLMPCENLTTLDIGKNNFVKISDANISTFFMPLKRLRKMYIVNARLRCIPKQLLTTKSNLRYFNAGGNGIQAFDDAFRGLNELEEIYLDGNNIRVIKPNFFPENIRYTLRKITLGSNPFECSCENLWFRQWVGDNGKPVGTNITFTDWPANRYICRTPASMSGKSFEEYWPTESSCSENHVILYVCITLGSILTLVVASLPVTYRYRWHIWYFVYRLRKRSTDPERESLLREEHQVQDPFTYVIYHDEDSEFVHNEFLNAMEKELGLKLYIWHRNADIGSKANIMFNAIESCSHVIALISDNFVKDGWCEFQLSIALCKKNDGRADCLTLVLMEDINMHVLRKSWCVTLARNATLYWCSNRQDTRRKLFEEQVKRRLNNY